LQAFAETACQRLYDDEGSCFEQIGRLVREAETWARLDPALAEAAQRLESLSAETQDLAQTFRALLPNYPADPARQEEVEERLRLLRRLETKYGRSVEDLIAYRATLDAQESQLQSQEDDRTHLEAELTTTFAQLRQVGAELSRQRHRVAKRFATAV